jgi:hypothetical protein
MDAKGDDFLSEIQNFENQVLKIRVHSCPSIRGEKHIKVVWLLPSLIALGERMGNFQKSKDGIGASAASMSVIWDPGALRSALAPDSVSGNASLRRDGRSPIESLWRQRTLFLAADKGIG